ncbi:PREDICTED: uncharacterized protein LOC109125964 [Camelina sativa]|uniref:Uncharacterized protein LOC109125964 n=1 Tax=Camelina sativa TaxID=90675 RepID=A0ABM1QC46_CAMSA|nr:PREDICTED: uncharacterized protein LOC109125964 [Camelina sativa]
MPLPVYTMNCFKLPKGICEEINRILANYWWSKTPGKRSMHSVSWERLGLPKKEGGLGFRDLEKFNMDLLGKQIWRILQAPTSLLTRFLKARYYSTSNIFTAGSSNHPSFIWKSLLEGQDMIQQGMRFLIGNGANTNVWVDPWLPTNQPRPPRRIEGINMNTLQVKDLITTERQTWNMDLIRSIIVDEDVSIIQRIRLGPLSTPDLLGWHYNDSCMYTVKSGYWLATHMHEAQAVHPPPELQGFKTVVWKMDIAPKFNTSYGECFQGHYQQEHS